MKTAEEIIDNHKQHSGIDYYYKSEIVPMMQEFAAAESEAFAEWIAKNNYDTCMDGGYMKGIEKFTAKELYQLYLKSKTV